MHHLCWAIKEGIRSKRKQIPCGRLLSEIFTQGKILEILKSNNVASDQILRIKTGKMINGKTLQNMKIIKKFSPNEKDLKESTAPTKLMTDFPPILQERNSEALAKLVAEYAKVSRIRLDTDVPAAAATEAPLQVRGKRTISEAGSEASGGQTKKAKGDKSDALNFTVSSASKKRTRVDSSSLVNQEKLAKAREERAKKLKSIHQKCELSKVQLTPELAKEASEEAKRLLAARKKEKAALKAARDAKLQTIGIDGSDDFYMEKLAEVKQIAESVEEFAVTEAVEMLEKIPEVDASEAALESASVAEASEAAAKVIQTSDSPSIIPTPISPSNESDQDDIPIS